MDDENRFDVSSVKDALADVTNAQTNQNHEASAIAREKGWVEPEKYDYAKYVTPLPLDKPAEVGQVLEDEDVPEWAANAAKYEWNDDYGDIGPENPALEDQLFRNDFINRAGLRIGK